MRLPRGYDVAAWALFEAELDGAVLYAERTLTLVKTWADDQWRGAVGDNVNNDSTDALLEELFGALPPAEHKTLILYSAMVMVATTLEEYLRHLALSWEQRARARNLLIDGSLEALIDSLEEHGAKCKQSPYWAKVNDLSRMRGSVVHSDGWLSEKTAKRLRLDQNDAIRLQLTLEQIKQLADDVRRFGLDVEQRVSAIKKASSPRSEGQES